MLKPTISTLITLFFTTCVITGKLTAMQPFAETKTHHADSETATDASATKRVRLNPLVEQEAEIKKKRELDSITYTADKKAWGTLAKLPMTLRKKINEFLRQPWHFKEAWLRRTLAQNSFPATSVDLFSLADSAFIITPYVRGVGDGTNLELWDKYKAITSDNKHDTIHAMTPINGATFATAGEDNLEIWQWETGENEEFVKIARSGINEEDEDDWSGIQTGQNLIKLSDTHMAAAHDDNTIKIWDISDLHKPKIIKVYENESPTTNLLRINDTSFITTIRTTEMVPALPLLPPAGVAGEPVLGHMPQPIFKLVIFDITDIENPQRHVCATGHNSPVTSLLHVAGSTYISASKNQIKIWDIQGKTIQPKGDFPGIAIEAGIRHIVKISPTHILATTETTASIWDISNILAPKCVTGFYFGEEIGSPIKFMADDSFAVSTKQNILFHEKSTAAYQAFLGLPFNDYIRFKVLLDQLKHNRQNKKTRAEAAGWFFKMPEVIQDNLETHFGRPFSAAEMRKVIERFKQQ